MSAKKARALVAVISDNRDAHIPYVQHHLDQPMIIIDPLTLLQGKTLSFNNINSFTKVVYGGQELDEVRAVWYRKPQTITADMLPVQPLQLDYVQSALQLHWRQIFTALNHCSWVSDYYAILRANDKPLQLEIANRLGFNVPATVCTTDKDVARAFIDSQGRVVMKSIGAFHTVEDGAHKMLYASIVERANLPDLDSLYLSPLIFQQAIDITCDIRVTVVGNKIFPAKIVTTGQKTDIAVRDWRLGHFEGDIHVEQYKDFPKDIAELCVQHCKQLGLAFGAIDMVMDKSGRLWFLENNPNGQWAFIEKLTGLPIGKAIAGLLQKGT